MSRPYSGPATTNNPPVLVPSARVQPALRAPAASRYRAQGASAPRRTAAHACLPARDRRRSCDVPVMSHNTCARGGDVWRRMEEAPPPPPLGLPACRRRQRHCRRCRPKRGSRGRPRRSKPPPRAQTSGSDAKHRVIARPLRGVVLVVGRVVAPSLPPRATTPPCHTHHCRVRCHSCLLRHCASSASYLRCASEIDVGGLALLCQSWRLSLG